MNTVKSCRTCRFHGEVQAPTRAEPTEEGGVPEMVMQTVHLCRCLPPLAKMINTPAGFQSVPVWPQVSPDMDWCGSYCQIAGTSDPDAE